MKVYIVEPDEADSGYENIASFNDVLIDQLMNYGVNVNRVNKATIIRFTSMISKDGLIVVYNEHKILDINSNKYNFLNKALETNIEIWPIAMDRKFRLPTGTLSQKQSYDVWEQLRCRDLQNDYLPTIAKIFARKVISRVFPTCYSEAGEVFLSHRRIDGEEIAAKIYDRMLVQANESTPFRDVVNVNVGENAQDIIDKKMENSDVFIFLHTPEAVNSEWILKELRFALLRCIPIVWVQIDDADTGKLKIFPSEKPHLIYKSIEFSEEKRLVEIVDEILQKAFALIMERSDDAISYIEPISELFGEKIERIDETNMVYHISCERKGYHYPQRNIEQYIQIFGRTPHTSDMDNLICYLKDKEKDSITILSNRIVTYNKNNTVFSDSIEDFYYHWNRYLYGKKEANNMEIVLSGAFPDGEESYKQCLTDALVIFEKVILKCGYKLTFGAHPTLQELFFEISKEIEPLEYRAFIEMYISRFFFEENNQNTEREIEYKKNCSLYITESMNNRCDSLSEMRKKMIQRPNVKALVCLGGKIKEDKSDEGIREEIQLAVQYGVPVFIVGSVGGCAAVVAKEYKKAGWTIINKASIDLNEKFLEDTDYFNMAHKMVEFLANNDDKGEK